MSYSRYCRYRAQLQRKQEEQLIYGDSSLVSGGNKNKATHREVDTMSTIRVLFCRDTYDYPAELLLQPFNSQQCHKKSTTVLANHMGMYIYDRHFPLMLIISFFLFKNMNIFTIQFMSV